MGLIVTAAYCEPISFPLMNIRTKLDWKKALLNDSEIKKRVETLFYDSEAEFLVHFIAKIGSHIVGELSETVMEFILWIIKDRKKYECSTKEIKK